MFQHCKRFGKKDGGGLVFEVSQVTGELRIDFFEFVNCFVPDMPGMGPYLFGGLFYIYNAIVDKLTVIG